MSSTTEKKTKSPSTFHSSIRLRRVVFLTKVLTSHSLALVWASLCLCVTAPLQHSFKVRTSFISHWKWQKKIAERIDANLLNVPIQKLAELPKSMFDKKIASLAKKTQGKLIIKEYPTASAHVGHFKSLVSDLALKRSIKPDIIFVDYLNICASERYKSSVVNFTPMLNLSQKNLGVLLVSVEFLSSLLHRPLVQVMVALMLILLILVNPLVFLLLLILCLPLLARRNLRHESDHGQAIEEQAQCIRQ